MNDKTNEDSLDLIDEKNQIEQPDETAVLDDQKSEENSAVTLEESQLEEVQIEDFNNSETSTALVDQQAKDETDFIIEEIQHEDNADFDETDETDESENSATLDDQKSKDDADVKKDKGPGFSLRMNEAEGDFEQMLEDYAEPELDEQDFEEEPEAELRGKLPYGGFEPSRLKSMLEGMIFAAGKTLTLGELQRLFEEQERPRKKDIK
ncbi:MAG: hypothetical protein HRU38_01880 [Saccharospirillaceae bacterium]|nr:hypothetical protein [Pseudomonadales bacterium]NRB77408.1 hypothetical protein [Saccharospirillaceae bacterium]